MISTVTLTFDLTYTNPLTGALEPRGVVTDSTNYSGTGGLGIDLLISQAKGLGVITFNGDVIVDLTNPAVPAETMINLQDWSLDPLNAGITPFFAFSLTLDSNGNVANGVYTLNYSLRLTNQFEMEIDAATATSLQLTGYEYLADFLEAGNDISNGAETVQVVSTSFTDPTLTINTTNITNPASWEFLEFDITNVQLNAVYTYSGCVQSAAAVTFSYDCEVGTNGTWAVANSTALNGQTITSLSATINYPAWTSLTPTFNSQIVTNTLPYSNNVLATGTFSVSLSQTIQRLQADGLILQYISSGVHEFVVSCAGSLCNLIPCIESLRNAHATELQRNRISKYQVFVDNVLMYYAEAQNYRSCGDIENYRKTLALIETQLDASGCECGCCDPDTYQWVNNNAASTIDSLINAIQFRLFNLDPIGPGSPTAQNDITQGVQVGALWQNVDTQVTYICLTNGQGTATWEEYYAPGQLPTAAEIPATPGTVLTSGFVQGQLTLIDTLAVFDATNGLTKIGNDAVLGGTLTSDVEIDANNNTMVVTSTGNLPFRVESNAIPFESRRITGAGPNAEYTLLQLTGEKTSGGGNGYGGTIDTRLTAGTAGEYTASSIVTKWINSGALDSNLEFQTSYGTLTSKLILTGDGLVLLPFYGDGDFTPAITSSTPTYNLSVNSSGAIIETSLGPLVYAGRTRFSAGSVTISEYGNTTGATISINSTGVGVYTLTASSSVFNNTSTVAFVQMQTAGFVTAVVNSGTVITINTYDTSGAASDAVFNAGSYVKVEVYP